MEGIDYAWGRPRPSELARLGKQFACRYLSYSTTGKNLTRAEADSLHAAGVATVANWEWYATDAKGGYSAGVSHAAEAKRQALACGMPAGRPIYFSADWDMTTADFPVVSEYFRGVRSVLGLTGTGIYGGYRAISQAASKGWASWYWQTFGWSNGLWHPAAHIQQYHNGVSVDGVDSDLDRAMKADFGQWGVTEMTQPTSGLTASQAKTLGAIDARLREFLELSEVIPDDLSGAPFKLSVVTLLKAMDTNLSGVATKAQIDALSAQFDTLLADLAAKPTFDYAAFAKAFLVELKSS